jgi:hypothetical protein
VLLTLLVLLGVVAVIGDRVAANYAGKQLREQVSGELAQNNVSYDSLDVGIGGFPFLTQVYRGHYDEITIDVANAKLPAPNGQTATLPSLHVVANGVDADTGQVLQGTANVNAERVAGTAVVSFSTLETLVDYSAYHLTDVKFSDEGGGLHATGRADLGPVEVPISATADITVVSGKVQIKLRDMKAVNVPAPAVLQDYLGDLAQQSLTAQLPQLPFGLVLDQVSANSAGLAISATGQNVELLK